MKRFGRDVDGVIYRSSDTFLERSASCELLDSLGGDGVFDVCDTKIFDSVSFEAPFDSAPAFFDGSAFLSHVERSRRARGATLPEHMRRVPLMYQGCAEFFLGPRDEVPVIDESFGLDCEAELAVILKNTPAGIGVTDAESSILGLGLLCDWTFRNLLPAEFETGFGFVQSKPPSSLAPFVCSYESFQQFRSGNGYAVKVACRLNDTILGEVDASQMHFSFAELIAHAARTRPLRAGTVIGSGTVSHSDEKQGVCCLTEKRAIEIGERGESQTEFLKAGDRVVISASAEGEDLFGAIDVVIA
jgi:fumarylacetoacetate (FAA) hydrolase